MPDSWLGRSLELDVGPPAHGGFCVARAGGRVVFVRHALPGERVRASVTEDGGGSFCRADAIEVLSASADRVEPPCPHAGPGRCGGCDWQHVSATGQRALKAAVIREQFQRLAGLDLDLDTVEELPGGLLGWRTRVLYAVSRDGTVGLHRHRSHDIHDVAHCPLGTAEVAVAPEPVPGVRGLELACDECGSVALIAHRPGSGRQARGRRPPDRVEVIDGATRLRHRVSGHDLELDATGFWQVHPHALATFIEAIIGAVAPRAGETILDLYAGAGALTVALAEAVGPAGRVIGVESSRSAVADAIANLAHLPGASVRHGRVDAALITGLVTELVTEMGTELGTDPGTRLASNTRPDVIVLDPPRAGAGKATMTALLAASPRCIGYLSCDPATLARDCRVAIDAGWQLKQLRAFDAFPMTQHVECLVLLVPPC